MASYHVADFGIEVIDFPCLHQGDEGMAESVETMAFMGMVPIIKIEVMEKASFDQRLIVEPHPFLSGISVGMDSHSYGMVIDAITAMGDVVSHALVFSAMDDRERNAEKVFIDRCLHAYDYKSIFLSLYGFRMGKGKEAWKKAFRFQIGWSYLGNAFFLKFLFVLVMIFHKGDGITVIVLIGSLSYDFEVLVLVEVRKEDFGVSVGIDLSEVYFVYIG